MTDHARRVAALQWRSICRHRSLLTTHALALFVMVMVTLNRLPSVSGQEAGGFVAGLLLLVVSSAPVLVGAHVLVAERTRGTMEAVLLLPMSKASLLAGKAIAILGLALAETGAVGIALLLGIWWLPVPTPGPVALLVLTGFQVPLLGALLTVIALIASGRTTDAQTASSLALLASSPVMAVVFGLWLGVLPFRPGLLLLLLLTTGVLLAVAFRAALALLSDETLVSRRA